SLDGGLVQHGAVGRVEGDDTALVGEDDPGAERADLGAVRGRGLGGPGLLAPAVGGSAVGAGAAGGEREHARAEQGDGTPLHDNVSHQVHAGKLPANENRSQLESGDLNHNSREGPTVSSAAWSREAPRTTTPAPRDAGRASWPERARLR